MRGGGYAGAQTRGGQGYALEPEGEIQGASYGRGWHDAGQMQHPTGLDSRAATNAGRAPRGYRRSDVRISEEVCDAMTDDPVLDPSDVDVRVEDCEVTLSGTVESRAMKRRAEDIAASIRGVVDVHNRLRVGRAGDSDRDSDRTHSRAHGEERAD
jgi:osmotically-inducible protein OsmY